jgi:hypothetical protein
LWDAKQMNSQAPLDLYMVVVDFCTVVVDFYTVVVGSGL